MQDNGTRRWMLYGAYGYTGKLVVEEALARGHRPLLAGRDARALQAMAAETGLDWIAVALDDAPGLARALAGVDLVYHVAGPFTHTAAPMREACLHTGTHYVDVNGESPVTRDTFLLHHRAQQAGILMLPSSGVNTVPTDAVSAFVHRQLPGADWLEVAIDTVHRQSSGSLVSMLEVATLKGQVRRRGMVRNERPGKRVRKVRFPGGQRDCVALPLADIHTAWHTTGIPNITAYVAQDFLGARLLQYGSPLLGRVFAGERLKTRAQDFIRRHVRGPDATARADDRTLVWALARDRQGRTAEAWLETLEGYSFTAAVAPHIVEAVFATAQRGVSTVAAAFGPDFVLRVRGTRRGG